MPAEGPVVAFDPIGPIDGPALFDDTLHVTGFRPSWDRVAARGAHVALDAPEGEAALALVCLLRDRTAAYARIAQALRTLRPGGWLVLDGQKTEGIDTTIRNLRKLLPAEGVVAKAHGKIAWFQRPETLPAELTGWTEAAVAKPNTDGMLTAPGMFSTDGIDPGTRMLIDHVPAGAKGTAVDLGAGWGALAKGALEKAPDLVSLDLVEADHAALESAKVNVTDPRAKFHWADATRWGGGPYDLVLSNPPFHVSRSADPSLGQAFIAAAAKLVTPRGQVLIVANRQLPYERTLDEFFRKREILGSDSRYKILAASLPRRDAKSA